jgi:O-antigen/teichoic acid export membrane protein
MTLLRLAVKAWVASKLLGAVPKPSWDRPRMATVFAFGKWTWVQALGAALFSTADRFLVGASLGAEALARYSICLQLAQQVQTIPAAGAQFLFPAISRRREAGEDYRRLAIRASLAIAALGAAMALPLALLPGPILRIWVGPEIAASSAGVLTWLAVAFAILAASVGPFYVLLGSGRERYATLVSLGAGLLAAVVAYLLLARLGLIGAVGGRLTYASLCLLLAVPIFAGAFRRGATPSS